MIERARNVVFNDAMDKMNNTPEEWSNDNVMAYELGMRSIDRRAQSEGGIVGMVHAFGRELSSDRPEQFKLIAQLSNWFERRNEETGECLDADRRTSKAFIKGVVTGLMVADETYAEVADVSEILEVVNIKDTPPPDSAASIEVREALNETLADIGRRGLDAMQEAAQFIERWESECVADYSYQFYYRLGFGLIMTSANKLVYDKSIDMLRRDIESGEIDWDKELQGILGGDL